MTLSFHVSHGLSGNTKTERNRKKTEKKQRQRQGQRQGKRQGLSQIQIKLSLLSLQMKKITRFQTEYDLTNEHSSAGDGDLRSPHHHHSDALVQTL